MGCPDPPSVGMDNGVSALNGLPPAGREGGTGGKPRDGEREDETTTRSMNSSKRAFGFGGKSRLPKFKDCADVADLRARLTTMACMGLRYATSELG